MANLRSHSLRQWRHSARLGTRRALHRRHGIILARLGRQLRRLASIRARPSRSEQYPRPLGRRAHLGAQSLRIDVELGPPQSGPRRAFARQMGRPWHRNRHRASDLRKRQPHTSRPSRTLAPRPSRALPGTGRRYVVRAHVPHLGETRHAETPQEFVKRIEDARLRTPVARFTEVYESARFGNSPDDAQRLPELYEEVETATRAK